VNAQKNMDLHIAYCMFLVFSFKIMQWNPLINQNQKRDTEPWLETPLSAFIFGIFSVLPRL